MRRLPSIAGLLALGLLAACAPGGTTQRTPAPGTLATTVPLPPDPWGEAAGVVEFGRVEVGRSAAATVYLTNEGEAPVRVERPVPERPFFADGPAAGFDVGPGERIPLVLGFVPADPGPVATLLTLRAGEVSLSLRLRGEGVAGPPCRLSAPAQEFEDPVDPLVEARAWVELRAEEGRCLLEGAEVEGDAFSLGAAPARGVTLLPGGPPLPLEVRFRPPDTGAFVGTLRILAGEATIEVPLQGTGGPRPPCFQWPEGVARTLFLPHPRCEGAPAIQELPLNRSGREVQLERFELAVGREEGLDLAEGSGTLTVPAGAALDVTAAPLDASGVGISGADGLLRYRFFGCTPLDLPVRVDGYAKARADSFFQASRSDLDLLVVVDDSPGMAQFDARLAGLAQAIALSMSGLDLHVGVTTTSTVDGDGCPAAAGRLLPIDGSEPRVLTRTTWDFEGRLARRLVGARCAAAGSTRGLEAAVRALTPPLVDSADDPEHPEPNDGNAGFRRPGTPLRILFVSADEDASPGDAEEAFQALAGIDGFRRVFALVGLSGGCWDVFDGERYRYVAERSGGWVGSICDVWTVPTGSLMALPPSMTRFGLSYPPVDLDEDGRIEGVDDSVAVRVGGAPSPEFDGDGLRRWGFDPGARAIVFAPAAVPGPGVGVELQYYAQCLR